MFLSHKHNSAPKPVTMRLQLPVSLISLLGATASAQTAISHAETALDTLNDWYNQTSGIWDTCGWWNGANCMTVLADLARFDKSEFVQSTALEVFNNTFHVAPSVSNPHPYKPQQPPQSSSGSSADTSNADIWVDGSYDDDSWWALAWIAAYDLTKKEEYLKIAIGIWEIHVCCTPIEYHRCVRNITNGFNRLLLKNHPVEMVESTRTITMAMSTPSPTSYSCRLERIWRTVPLTVRNTSTGLSASGSGSGTVKCSTRRAPSMMV